MNKLTILIKPVSSQCNINCSYCFYKDIVKTNEFSPKKMKADTTINLIEKVFRYCDDKTIIEFCFQGGEPLLAGLDFYNMFFKKVKKQNKRNQVCFTIQTNGLLIDEGWIKLFKENNFLVGISLDGIKETHDFNRKSKNNGTFDQVIKNVNLLKINEINYNILTVVTSNMITYPKKIYTFYKKMNFEYVQFIPCLSFFGKSNGLKPKEYAQFFSELYKIWSKDRKIHISLFEEIINIFFGQRNCLSCGKLGYCSLQFVIETDGSVYPCDFYVLQKYCIGNINNHSFDDLLKNTNVRKFLEEEKNFSYLCDTCKFYTICQGNYKRQNQCMFDDYYCGYQILLENIYKDIIEGI